MTAAPNGTAANGDRHPAAARRSRTRNRQAPSRRPADFWRAVPAPPLPPPIVPAVDPTAMLRSLGPPPLSGQSDADRYMAAVVNKAAVLAGALAAQADLLPPDDIAD